MEVQAFAQIPDVEVYYGPDTYMGRNLAHLLQNLASASDVEVCPLLYQLNFTSALRMVWAMLTACDSSLCVLSDVAFLAKGTSVRAAFIFVETRPEVRAKAWKSLC